MAATQSGKYQFVVKENLDGTPWIYLEPLEPEQIKFPEGGFIGFNLPKGTELEEAETIADYLDQKIESVFLTTYGEDIKKPES